VRLPLPQSVRRGILLGLLLIPGELLAGAALPQSAPPGQGEPESDTVEPLQRAAGLGATLSYGALAHGAGHYVIDEPATARRLLLWEGMGVAGLGLGGVTFVVTGASRYFALPGISLVILGGGIFVQTWLADLYGVSGLAEVAGSPTRVRPSFEAALGVGALWDRRFGSALLVDNRIAGSVGATIWRAELASLPSRTSSRGRVELGLFVIEPAAPRPASDGSFLELGGALTEHRETAQGFSTSTFEVALSGRLDLARIGPTLRGAFAELGSGVAFATTRYHTTVSVPSDDDSLLLGRIGFGMYLGRGPHHGSEVLGFYDHRHDGYVGGLTMGGLMSGTLGRFGLSSRVWLSEAFGVTAVLETGAATHLGLGFGFRSGGGG